MEACFSSGRHSWHGVRPLESPPGHLRKLFIVTINASTIQVLWRRVRGKDPDGYPLKNQKCRIPFRLEQSPSVDAECQDVGRHSMTKRPDGCRPAACTSNPAARASSRNSARLRSLPPTKTIISKDGDGPQSSSGDTPPRTTMRPAGRAASAPQDGHRLAIGPVAQHVFQQIEIGPGWQRVEEALPHRGDAFGHAGNLKDLNGSSHGRREIDQRAPHLGPGARISASSDPVPPPTSTTVRTIPSRR